MRKMGISALVPQPGTSQRNPPHKVFPYLLRKLAINYSNQVWALNTAYIRVARGFVHLTAVVYVYSRRILAHRIAITLKHAMQSMHLKRPSNGLESPKSSTRIKAVSSPRKTSSMLF